MNYASTDLREEHVAILSGLKILEEMATRLEDHQLVETEDIEEMIGFFKKFADQCHHGKEEGMYFPALEAAGVHLEHGPIGAMLDEHQRGRAAIARMEQILSGEFKPYELAASACEYVQLLREHISKEDNGLFKLGDEQIPPEAQAALLEQFERFEAEVMGGGLHEQLHEMLDCMSRKYLS